MLLKGTIALEGATVQFECNNASEFAEIIAGLNRSPAVNKVAAPDIKEVVHKLQHTTSRGAKRLRGRYKKGTPWSDRDLVNVAKIVRDNLELKSGLSSIAITYVRKLGDYKARDKSTIYTLVSDLKQHLKGTPNSLRKNMEGVLERADIFPGQRKLTVREA